MNPTTVTFSPLSTDATGHDSISLPRDLIGLAERLQTVSSQLDEAQELAQQAKNEHLTRSRHVSNLERHRDFIRSVLLWRAETHGFPDEAETETRWGKVVWENPSPAP